MNRNKANIYLKFCIIFVYNKIINNLNKINIEFENIISNNQKNLEDYLFVMDNIIRNNIKI